MPHLFARLRPYLPVLVGAALLVPHALWFNFVNDDAYISFRYAKNLAEHGQLVYNLGERVEGYTNFLWTVLLAGGMKMGLAPELASRGFGLLFAILGLGVVVRWSLRLDGGPRVGHFMAPLALAGSSAYACWATGGLETQLFTFLFLLASERFTRELDTGRGYASGFVFALAALCRPEGVLFFSLAAFFRVTLRLLHQRRLWPSADELRWAAAFAVVFVPYLAWRWSYYGWPLPNTFYVKSSGATGALAFGLYYLRRFVEDHMLYALAPLIVMGWPTARTDPHGVRRRLFAYVLLVTAVFAAYVARVGGDFMGLYRFVLPVVPLGALVLQESLRTAGARLAPWTGRPALAVAGLLLAGGYAIAAAHTSHHAMTFIGADRGIDSPGYLKHYADQRIPIGKWFAAHARPDDLMTVGGAGVIAYHSNIRAYDVFGLVDETIAHDPAMTVSQRPGHQKWGTDVYMVSRKPTLITHHYQIHAVHAPDPAYWSALGYEWVTATIPGLSAPPLYSFLKRKDRAFGPFPASPALAP
jgi:hypothetical protein